MKHPAPADPPIHELLAQRYSPRAFTDQEVTPAQMRALIEAARWAASCFNDQPWHYIVATRRQPEAFERLLGCLVEANRRWAAKAPVLMLAVARSTFAHNGKPNPHAWHDLGQASAQLALQAAAMGLQIHQMAGFDRDEARQAFAIPEDHEPVAAIAVGHPGAPDSLPEDLAERERAPRQRKPVSDFVHGATWGEPAAALDE